MSMQQFDSTCGVTDIGCWLGWLVDELRILIIGVYGWLLDGLTALFDLIPVPDFLQNMPSYTIPSGVAFFADVMQLQIGVGIVVSAYVLRFLVRRIPIIG